MDIDDIFKRPPLPKGALGNKRKFEAPLPPDPNSNSSEPLEKVQKTGNGGGVTLEDYDDNEDEDGQEGGDFAPGGDADYYEEEDEDGRFFGGGLSSVQKQVLQIFDSNDPNAAPPPTAADDLTPSGVRKQLLALEKSINKNRELRTRFSSDPEKFVDSEFNLIQALSSLLLLSSVPTISYPLLLDLSTLSSLSDLLSHENSDVIIAVIELLEELTDEEVLEVDDAEEEEGDEEEEEGEKRRMVMGRLVEGLREAGVVELVVAGLGRLDETEEAERNGVYHTFGLIENLLNLESTSFLPSLLSPKSSFLSFLLSRIQPPSKDSKLSGDEFLQNRYYAGELLSILLGVPGGAESAVEGVVSAEGVDGILKVLSGYRRKDPSDGDELEFVENVFTSLSLLLPFAPIKSAFLEGEGVELMVLMMKEKKMGRTRAVRVLDYATQGCAGSGPRGEKAREVAEKVVEEGGMKFVFGELMGKAKKGQALTHADTEHLLSLLASLFISLPSNSPSRIRLLTKFVENDYEKIDRLVELREEIEGRIEKEMREEEGIEEMESDELYLIKMEKGGFSLQLTDYLLAWGAMEDDGIKDHLLLLFSRKSRSLSDIIAVLKEYQENIGDGVVPEEGQEVDEATLEALEQRSILDGLVGYLESVKL